MSRSVLVVVWILSVLYFFIISVPLATACLHIKVPKTLKNKYCRTETCVQESKQIQNFMSVSVNPCSNFYQFACGDFLNNTYPPSGKFQVDQTSMTEDKVQVELANILQEDSSLNETKPFTVAKRLYQACINTTNRDSQSLLSLLTRLGGWPVLEGQDWKEEEFDWLEISYKIHDEGFPNFLMDLQVVRDPMDNTKNILTLGHALYPSLLDHEIDKYLYKSFLAEVAVMLGADRKRANNAMALTATLENDLLNSTSKGGNATSRYNPMTVAELKEKYPGFPWNKYFQRMLPANIVVNDDEIIVVQDPMYISTLDKILWKGRNKRNQADYMLSRVVLESIRFVDSQFTTTYEEYMMGASQGYAKSMENCVQTVYGLMPMSVSELFFRKHSNVYTNKYDIMKIVDDTKAVFLNMLKNFNWMDNTTRERALDKLAAMTAIVGYPYELILDPKNLPEMCEDYSMTKIYDYLDGYLTVARCIQQAKLNTLRIPRNESYALMFLNYADVKVHTILSENKIVIPMAFLYGSFFNDSRPAYLNYAKVGYAIARSIIRNFDFEGREYDKNGNLFNWWTATTEKNYRAKIPCVIEQYGSYVLSDVGVKLNNLKNHVENIADILGTRLAYLTYLFWNKLNGPEPELLDLPYTHKQLFWISLANSQCTVYKLNFVKSLISEGTSTPAEFRILGAFSNTLEFADVFNCPMSSKMNPEYRCLS